MGQLSHWIEKQSTTFWFFFLSVGQVFPGAVFCQASPNIALKAFMIKPSNFVGLSCAALQQASLAPDWGGLSHGGGDRPPGIPGESLLNFTCNSANLSSPLHGLLSKVRVNWHQQPEMRLQKRNCFQTGRRETAGSP